MKNVMILGYLTVLAFWDMKEKKLPVWLLTVGTMCGVGGLIALLWLRQDRWQWEMLEAGLAVLPGVFLMVMARLTQKAGLGDGWTLLNVGMFESYKTCVFLLGISLVIMAMFSAVLLVLRRAQKNTKIPYMPFLALAYFCKFLF